MTTTLFTAPGLKIDRAEHHLKNLEVAVNDYLDRDPYQTVVEYHPFAAGIRRVVRVREEIPEDLPLVIGDTIHNLRSALDLLACDLVRLNGKNINNVYFPFCENGQDLDDMIKRRNLHRASPDVVDLLRSMKPYRGGNDALRGIHDLDIADKHKLIIPVVGRALLPVLHFDFTNQLYIQRKQGDFVVTDGTVIDPYLPSGTEHKLRLPTLFSILFGHGQPFEGEHIVETLQKLCELTRGIIETFEAHLQGGDTP